MAILFDQYITTTSGIFSLSEIASVPEGLNLLHPFESPVTLKPSTLSEEEGIIIYTGIGASFIVSPQTLLQTDSGWVQASKIRDSHRLNVHLSDIYPEVDPVDLRNYESAFSELPKPIFYDEGIAFGQGVAYGLASSRGSIPLDQDTLELKDSNLTIKGFPEDMAPESCFIPWELYRSPKNVVLSFLKGLFKFSGLADSESIILKVRSYTLASEVQFLLINLGVLSSVNFDGVEATVVIDTKESALKFKTLIGFQDLQRDSFLDLFISNYSDTLGSTPVMGTERSLLNSYKIPEVSPFYLGAFCVHPR
jgi:hypothetical protein